MVQNIPTLYSNYQECILDIDIFGKIVSTPHQSIQEMTDALFEEFKRRKPLPTLECQRYELSKLVSPDYRIVYNRELELQDNESLVDLTSSSGGSHITFEDLTPLIREVQEVFAYENAINDDLRQTIIDTYDLETGEEFKPGIKQTEDIVGSTKQDESTILTDEQIYALGSTSNAETVYEFEDDTGDTGITTYEFEDDSASDDAVYQFEEDVSEVTEFVDEDVGEPVEDDDFSDYDYSNEDDYDSSENDSDLQIEDSEFDELDYSEEQIEDTSAEETTEEYTEDSDDYDYSYEEDESDVDDYDYSDEEESSEPDDYDYSEEEESIDEYDYSEEESVDEYDYSEEAESDVGEDVQDEESEDWFDSYDDEDTESSIEEDAITNEAVDTSSSMKLQNEEIEKSSGVVTSTNNSFVDSVLDDVDDDIEFITEENKQKVVPTPITPAQIPRPVEKEVVDRESEPTDIRQFVRKHPHCEYEFALKYFTKKQINDAVRIGKIIKKGNILKI